METGSVVPVQTQRPTDQRSHVSSTPPEPPPACAHLVLVIATTTMKGWVQWLTELWEAEVGESQGQEFKTSLAKMLWKLKVCDQSTSRVCCPEAAQDMCWTECLHVTRPRKLSVLNTDVVVIPRAATAFRLRTPSCGTLAPHVYSVGESSSDFHQEQRGAALEGARQAGQPVGAHHSEAAGRSHRGKCIRGTAELWERVAVAGSCFRSALRLLIPEMEPPAVYTSKSEKPHPEGGTEPHKPALGWHFIPQAPADMGSFPDKGRGSCSLSLEEEGGSGLPPPVSPALLLPDPGPRAGHSEDNETSFSSYPKLLGDVKDEEVQGKEYLQSMSLQKEELRPRLSGLHTLGAFLEHAGLNLVLAARAPCSSNRLLLKILRAGAVSWPPSRGLRRNGAESRPPAQELSAHGHLAIHEPAKEHAEKTERNVGPTAGNHEAECVQLERCSSCWRGAVLRWAKLASCFLRWLHHFTFPRAVNVNSSSSTPSPIHDLDTKRMSITARDHGRLVPLGQLTCGCPRFGWECLYICIALGSS
ncbi:hypothetical protein AAY473_008201 [Plecturocebus cupreus]